MGQQAALSRPDLQIGSRVTANPLVTCGQCEYCLTGHQQLCPKRKLLSAALPGSNAEYVAVAAVNMNVVDASVRVQPFHQKVHTSVALIDFRQNQVELKLEFLHRNSP